MKTMSNKQKTTGNLAISEPQQRVVVIEATEKPQDLKLHVAAYTRVSSDSADQLNSFAAQNRYYTALISGKENWSMVDIYADCGITGTSAAKREDFQRLMEDCRRGLIDKVLCKSISRFARNTTECLEAIRELKALGIGIEFEEQHIDTAKLSGETLTAIFASMAQSESKAISDNMRWSYQRRMENGSYVPACQPFGYVLEENKIQIHSEHAEVIQEIFRQYLSGIGAGTIANNLNSAQIGNRFGEPLWTPRAIRYIIKNEKYTGNSRWHKYYTTDTLPFRNVINHGEKESYYATGTHEAIISNEDFASANVLMQQRATIFSGTAHKENVSGALRQKIRCDMCGNIFRRKTVRGHIYWVCLGHDKKLTDCTITQIPEVQIHAAFLRLYYKLKHQGSNILPQMLTTLRAIRSQRMLWSEDVIELNKRISNITSQNQLLAMLKQQGGVDPDIFISRSNELAEQLRIVKLEKERLLNAYRDDTIAQTQTLIETIGIGPDFLEEFDGELFGELVDKITVESNECLRFRLKNGLELMEPIERTVR